MIPALSRFTGQAVQTLGVMTDNSSGIAYCGTTNTLFVVRNKTGGAPPPVLYEYSIAGAHLRTITLTGFDDVEGICWTDENDFCLVEEDNAHLCLVTITAGTTTLDKTADATVIDTGLGPLGNTGLEGVTYDRTNDWFYAVKEKTPIAVYKVEMDGTTTALFDAPALLGGTVTDLAGCYYDNSDGHLYVLSEESNVILKLELDGEILESSTLPAALTQPEGITFSETGRRLWIVGEANELRICAAAGSPVLPSEFSHLVPDPNEAVWSIWAKFYAQSFLWEKWRHYAFGGQNAITPEFEADLCEARNRELEDS